MTSFSDTGQLSLLSGSYTPAKSFESDQKKDGSPVCKCGKGTSDCSIHPSTPESWTAFMQASLAKTLALLESKQEYLREPDQVFTAKSCASLAWFDRDTCSWRTYQQSFLTDSEPFSETWPRWGMTRDGYAYAHPMSERRITETGGSYSLPTPTAAMEAPNKNANTKGPKNLVEVAQGKWNHLWPTPTATEARQGYQNRNNGMKGSQESLSTVVVDTEGGRAATSGQLNPDWVGWLMGFPIAWANSKDTETPKSRSKPPQLGDCLEGQ